MSLLPATNILEKFCYNLYFSNIFILYFKKSRYNAYFCNVDILWFTEKLVCSLCNKSRLYSTNNLCIWFCLLMMKCWVFPHSSEEPACNSGNPGLISGLGRSPGKGIDNPLQYSLLENPMDRGAWQATVHGFQESART